MKKNILFLSIALFAVANVAVAENDGGGAGTGAGNEVKEDLPPAPPSPVEPAKVEDNGGATGANNSGSTGTTPLKQDAGTTNTNSTSSAPAATTVTAVAYEVLKKTADKLKEDLAKEQKALSDLLALPVDKQDKVAIAAKEKAVAAAEKAASDALDAAYKQDPRYFAKLRDNVSKHADKLQTWCVTHPKTTIAIVVGVTAITTAVVIAKSKTVQKFLGIAPEEDEDELFV